MRIRRVLVAAATTAGLTAALIVSTPAGSWASAPNTDPGGGGCTISVSVTKAGSTRTSGPKVFAKVTTNTCNEQIRAYGHATQGLGRTDWAYGNIIGTFHTGTSTATLPNRAGEALCSWGYQTNPGTGWITHQTGIASPDPC